MYCTKRAIRAPAAIVVAGLAASLWAGAAGATDFASRAAGPTESQLLERGDQNLDGLAFVRPVLSGVLYRAGFRGGDKAHTGLSPSQRLELCESGFSAARYVDFGSRTEFGETQCGEDRLDYARALSSRPAELMQDIHGVIEDPNRGPLLVHCMWGVHASGAVAAMALVQFCGWSEEQAKTYWHKARNNASCGSGGCDKWINDKFDRFEVDPNLRISETQQQGICPQ